MIKESDFNKLYQEGERLVEYLPWLYEEEGIFLLVDGSLGKMWEISTREAEFKGDTTLDTISKEFEALLKRLPEGVCYQVIFMTSPNIEEKFRKYQEYKEGTPAGISEITIKEKIGFLKDKPQLFKEGNSTYSLRQFKAYFVMKVEFSSSTSFPSKEYLNKKRELTIKSGTIEKLFEEARIPFTPLKGQELVSLLCNIFNPERVIAPHLNSEQEIREQILFTQVQFEEDGLVFNDTKATVISIKALPLQTFPGMLTLFSNRPPVVDISGKVFITCNFYIDNQGKELGRIKTKNAFAFMHRLNFLGGRSVESDVIQRETERTIEKIYTEGKKIINASLHFIIYHPVENKAIVDDVLNTLHFLSFEGFEETIIGPGVFLRSCPFGFNWGNERFVKRCCKFVSDNLADIVPLYGYFRGTDTPAQLYTDRHGQVICFDLFDSNSPHGIISGITGAGKSFFVNDLIIQNLRLGASFFIFDRGGSYQKLCEVNGGQYIEIDPKTPTRINLFQPPSLTTDQLAFLVAVVSEMASGGEERESLRREERSFIQRCIEMMYSNPPVDKEHTLGELVEIMRKEKISFINGEQIAYKLSPFVGGGQYAGFFDGVNQLNISNNFVVFEMGSIGVWKDLQVVLLLTLMYLLTEQVAKQRAVRKFLLIDEAWSLLNTENTATFLENAYRTFRKYRCSVVAITQQVEDFTRTIAGKTILANAVNRIFLAQNPEVIERMKETLSLSPPEINVLKAVKTQKGLYSEAVVKLEEKQGVIRLVPSNFAYWLFTTDPKDIQKIKEVQEEFNYTTLEAISYLAKREEGK